EVSGQRRFSQEKFTPEDAGREGSEETREAEGGRPVKGSARMGNVSGKSASLSRDENENVLQHTHYQKQIRQYSQKEKRRKQQLQDTPAEAGLLSEEKEQIKKKQKRGRRLAFEDEGPQGSFVYGSGTGFGRKAAARMAGTVAQGASYGVHRKV